MKYFFSVLILFMISNQVIGQLREVEGKILNASTNEEIPFANIWNRSIQKGTISNVDGFFKLQVGNLTDTIVVSAVGYKSQMFVLDEKIDFYLFKMKENIVELSEVTIKPKDDFYLYELLSKCKNQQNKHKQQAKSYYELKTYVNESQVELVEGFFNAEISGYELKDHELKAGRIAMKRYQDNKRMFVSYESSKSFLLSKVMNETNYFPLSPFSLNSKKMRRSFFLKMDRKYLDDEKDSIVVISYSPRKKSGEYYTGKIWLNTSTNRLLKITMNCEECKVHPFLPLHPMDSILLVNLQITKTFAKNGDNQLFNHVDFNYAIAFKSRFGKLGEMDYVINTKALFYAYDYEQVFTIPKFYFDKDASDYRKILSMPTNDFFWKYNDEYQLNDSKNTNDVFMSDSTAFINGDLNGIDPIYKNGKFFQQPYVKWSTKRVIFKDYMTDTLLNNHSKVALDRNFNLAVQVFFDRNTYKDSTNMLTCTIFDPYQSYYLLPIDNKTNCFINIYFDLCEIERRKFEVKLKSKEWSEEEIEGLYSRFVDDYNLLKNKYLRFVDHGDDRSELSKWNTLVMKHLKIDNMALFEIQ